jgi:hypothetical protein
MQVVLVARAKFSSSLFSIDPFLLPKSISNNSSFGARQCCSLLPYHVVAIAVCPVGYVEHARMDRSYILVLSHRRLRSSGILLRAPRG